MSEDGDDIADALAGPRRYDDEHDEVVVIDNDYAPVDQADPALAPGLRRILARLPEGGRQIDVDLGWHSLIVRLDETLVEIEPGYLLRQVKQKLGGLQYYAIQPELSCSSAWREEAGTLEGVAWTAHEIAWRTEHCESAEHRELLRLGRFIEWGAVIRAAEAEALSACERCGRQAAEMCEAAQALT